MQSWTWTNSSRTRRWTDAKNWSPEGVPQDGDEVTIPAVDAWGNTGGSGPAGAPALSLSNLTLQGLTLYDGPFTVTKTLAWSGGLMDADVTVSGDASVSGLDGSVKNPGIVNNHTLKVSGTATITGTASLSPFPRLLIATGGKLVNTGSLTLSGAGFASNGGFGVVTNAGTLSVTGSSATAGGALTITHNAGAQLDIAALGEFIVGAGTVLKLAGGKVTGYGTLQAGDGNGGEIDVPIDTTVPQLVIGGNGTVSVTAAAGTPPPTLTVSGYLGWGDGSSAAKYSALVGHLILLPGATGHIGNHASLTSGKVENAGHVTVAANTTLTLQGTEPTIVNSGTLTLSGTCTAGFGTVTSTGLIEKTGTGVALFNVALTSKGNVAVSGGTLQIGGGDWTIPGGTVSLAGGARLEGAQAGRLVLTGGPQGGVLAGAGTVAANVVNGGWVEPAAPGLTITSYTQQPTGNIALPSAAAAPLLTLGGANLHLDGSLWVLA
jgi:filamentous hemagglutinin